MVKVSGSISWVGLRTFTTFVLGHLTAMTPCPKTDIYDYRGQVWRKIHWIFNLLECPGHHSDGARTKFSS